MIKDPNDYFVIGCMRCKLGATPACKVHTWTKELQLLRSILVQSGLQEEAKWGMPCYTLKGKNVVLLAAFKDNCSIQFFRGSELSNEHGLLTKAGENTQHGRLIRFTSINQIQEQVDLIKSSLFEAIELEKKGIKPAPKQAVTISYPEALENAFKHNPQFRERFVQLSPGKQRGYIMLIQGAKQNSTKEARIQKIVHELGI